MTRFFTFLSACSLLAATSLSAYAAGNKQDISWGSGDQIAISIPDDARPVVATAAGILNEDLGKVLKASSRIATNTEDADIIISINPAEITESQGFAISVSDNGKLLIKAHDSHGAAYGLLEISRLLGVSPWKWWADSNPVEKTRFVIPADYTANKAPSVEYRGIFINDEDWGLMPWSYKNHDKDDKGIIGPATTAKIFELLLRLRANTYWPPMHECSVPFFLTPGNREVAEKYGIYIGGSHCEPMASSTAGEWPRRGTGDYDYNANPESVRDFWESRLKEVAGQEIIYTLGMRGVHDSAMKGAKGVDSQKKLLSQVIADQRGMLAKHNLTSAPQVFIPYKEVLDIYNAGFDVPDDVTLMWCDDNYGYIKHFPDSIERNRKGGNGIYYHVSYWGRPHDYLWLGTFSPGLLHQQMSEAFNKGIDRMWILNVGDIKPAEYQIELFMDMAWDFDRVKDSGVERHARNFLVREFGEAAGNALTPLMKEYYRLAHIRKPEFMGNTRTEEKDRAFYNTVRDLPFTEKEISGRLASYQALSDSVEKIERLIPSSQKEAFFQLVKYPVLASDQMNRKFLYGQLARHGKADWSLSHAAYDSIQSLTARYNSPKWEGIMDSHPRKLPVFNRLTETIADSIPLKEDNAAILFNGKDGKGWKESFEWLGYENGAVSVAKGDSLVFEIKDIPDRKAKVEIRLLPTHSVSGSPLQFIVAADGNYCQTIDYSTHGRSEEWKENVLWNQSRKTVDVSFSDTDTHRISITPVADPVIVDQVILSFQ